MSGFFTAFILAFTLTSMINAPWFIANLTLAMPRPGNTASSLAVHGTERQDGHITFRLKLPAKTPGNLTIEAENNSGYQVALLRFSLRVLGQGGELYFEDIGAGQKKSQSVAVENVLELAIDDVVVVDEKVQRRSPKISIVSIKSKS